MRFYRFTLILVFFLSCQINFAQDSTAYPKPSKSIELLKEPKSTGKQASVYNRRVSDALDIPANIYIVEQQEILDQGYLTLVDVLESVPGIMTSQPGNAINGEQFNMRGLLGNFYCKILINDIPITPTGAAGMPIGAQLPIRQAKRIEILFGPAASIYGSDAVAGVINIITKDTKRVSIIEGDVTIGNFNYNQINLLIAGKLGRNVKKTKYSLFANYMQSNDMNIYGANDSLFDPTNYYAYQNSNVDYRGYRNFEPENGDTTTSLMEKRNLPDQSLLIGGTLEYGGFELGYLFMQRQTHGALGTNPLTASYSDPTTQIGEGIHRFNLGYKKKFENVIKKSSNDLVYSRLNTTSNISFTNYRLNRTSSQRNIFNSEDLAYYDLLEEIRDRTTDSVDLGIIDALQDVTNNIRANRAKSFWYGGSDDLYFEEIVNYYRKVNSVYDYSLTGGLNFTYSGNLPIQTNLETQFDDKYNGFSTESFFYNTPYQDTVELTPILFYNVGAFFQGDLHYKKWTATGGLRYDYHDIFGDFWNPRLGLNYRVNTKASIRGAYNSAHRVPTTYYIYNSFDVGILASDTNPSIDRRNPNDMKAEKMNSYELGFKYNFSSKSRFDVIGYYNEITNVLEREYVRNIQLNDSGDFFSVRNSYVYDNNPLRETFGFKISMFNDELLKNLSSKFSFSYTEARQYYGESNSEVSRTVFNLPKFFVDWVLIYKVPLKNQSLFLELNNIYSSSYQQGYVIKDIVNDQTTIQKYEFTAPAAYRLNFEVRYATSSRLEIFGRLYNVLNTSFSGFSASNSIDDIYINPQRGRRYHMGVSYRIGRNPL